MSITKSYNKHTGIYYAYETTYQWDETLKKNVQKKRCIGHFDPITSEVIQNGKRGRPVQTKSKILSTDVTTVTHCTLDDTTSIRRTDCYSDFVELAQMLTKFATSLNAMQSEIVEIENQLSLVLSKINRSDDI